MPADIGLIREGDRSPQVADVQTRLRALGFTIDDDGGVFGHSTKLAVRSFQQQRTLLVDGIVGPQTWSELVGASWRLGDRILYLKVPPMRGDDVLQLQRQLNAMGFDAGKQDAIFGEDTDRAVRAFQKEYGVAEDGIFGPMSLASLHGLRIDRPGSALPLREELTRLRRAGASGAVVVIDPGHGDDDRGALDPAAELCEDDVCWAVATRVSDRLVAAGADVHFTRTRAENPTASERARRANDFDADLFLSIHMNAHRESSAAGASTFYFGGSTAGEALAEEIHDRLVGLGLTDCRTHARAYALLKETRMPAVLVEPAFITNPGDAQRLRDARNLDRIADAIAAGTLRYFVDET